MRTTLNVDDDIFQIANGLALTQKISIGKALSNLARKGLRHQSIRHARSGFHMFQPSPEARRFGPRDIEAAEQTADSQFSKNFPRQK